MARAIIEILQSFYAVFTADSGSGGFYDAVGGRFYQGLAPDDVSWPFATFFIVSSDNSTFGTFSKMIETTRIQIDAYSQTDADAEVLGIQSNIWTLFDRRVLTGATGWVPIVMNRDDSQLLREDNGVWRFRTDYILMNQEA